MRKLCIVLGLLVISATAVASDGMAASGAESFKFFAYFIGMAIASFGGTRAQSNAASVALEGIARNPSASGQLLIPMMTCCFTIRSGYPKLVSELRHKFRIIRF